MSADPKHDEVRSDVEQAREQWQHTVVEPALHRFDLTESTERFYSPLDLGEFDFLEKVGFPGEYPFTAGPYPFQPGRAGAKGSGQIPQGKGLARAGRYSGFGTADDSAEYYRRMIAAGQQAGPNVAFDLPTQCGYDSDHPMARGEVGRTGVAIDSLDDFARLYEPFTGAMEINRIGSNWTINAPAAVVIAMYIVLAERRGLELQKLRATPQNDILKEYIARGTYIFPIEHAMRLMGDIFSFVTEHVPSMNVLSAGGYHMREAGATRELDLGFSIANLTEYLRTGQRAGVDIDVLARRITVNAFGGSVELFPEVALQRAARRMWAKVLREDFGAKDPRSWVLRQPSGAHMGYYSATSARPLNNVTRAVIGAIAGALSGYPPTVEPPFDEALGLGWSPEAMQLSEDAARILQLEAHLTEVRDPLAGSYYIESLTDEIEASAWKVVAEVEEHGGSAAAIRAGFMQGKITEAAVDRARATESGERVVVGVNAFLGQDEIEVEVRRNAQPMYPEDARASAEHRQVQRLADLRRRRDGTEVRRRLADLDSVARGASNTLPAIVECVRADCTIGEICQALRDVWGEAKEGNW
jgi:methylmalonyl-CoA mutase N-terminal domain/subunit